MASGSTFLLPGMNLTVAPRPGTETQPVSPDKTDFSNWVRLRAALSQPSRERPLSEFAAERIKALLKKYTPEAVAEAAKGITTEDQRRKDAAAAKITLLAAIEDLISKFQGEHPKDALLVWEDYLKALEENKPQVDFIEAEIKESKERIKKLKALYRK